MADVWSCSMNEDFLLELRGKLVPHNSHTLSIILLILLNDPLYK